MILGARVYDVAIESPLDPMPRMSARLGVPVLIKREDLQPVFSFKLRGAYNKIVSLPADVRARGIVTASAGNHAQGVALAASKLGINATIVMPRTHPLHQGRGGARARRRRRGALRRRVRRGAGARARARGRARPHLRAALRRPCRDRRPGHDRHGDPAPAPGPDRGDLHSHRRRRAGGRQSPRSPSTCGRRSASSASSRRMPRAWRRRSPRASA